MSDKGEKTCPLCMEEMDLTDQQLKPCKCGYEICVWCWHHIMDMAEKDDTEGQCPACRTPYDKEKIVGMAAHCGSLVAEIDLERKQKVQKPKPKASEGRKHLGNVRVIQRNLVYVIGLPLSLADEELLKRREYFSQYGKVLKVSISRTASGVIHNSSNDSFSVYITYSKEEEAVRCIQSVHNYQLEGRSLRACFGTSKYCNSWLKNVPCSNHHCLYLHNFGSHEDCLTKDEIVSAFTRGTVQQIVGATHCMQLHSGNALPPPADKHNSVFISSTAKPVVKGPSYNTENQVKGSVPDASTGKSGAPPTAASCIARVSTSSNANSSGLTGTGKQKPDTSMGPVALPSVVLSAKKLESDVGKRFTMAEESLEVHLDGKMNPPKSTIRYIPRHSQTNVSKENGEVLPDATPAIVISSSLSPSLPPKKEGDGNIAVSSGLASLEFAARSCSSGPDKYENLDVDGELQSLCSGLSSISVHCNLEDEHSMPVVPESSISNHFSMIPPESRCLQLDNRKQHGEALTSPALEEDTVMVNLKCVDKDEGSLALDDLGLKGSEGIYHQPSTSFSPSLLQISNQSNCHSLQPYEICSRNNINVGPRHVPVKADDTAFPLASSYPVLFSGGIDNKANSFADLDKLIQCSSLFPDVQKGTHLGIYGNDVASFNHHGASDMGESHITSDILALGLDMWDDPLTASHSFDKKLAESDKQHGSYNLPNFGKVQNSNQSRFLFARMEDLPDQIPDLEHSFNDIRHGPSKVSFPQDCCEENDQSIDKSRDIIFSGSFADSDNICSSHPLSSSKKLPASGAQISTPPGFLVPSRTPPPGFSSHERVDLAVHKISGVPIQFPPIANVGSPLDVELNDPAILEVGKAIPIGGLSNTGLDMWQQTSSAQLNPFEYEARLQFLMQHPSPVYQNPKLVNYFAYTISPQNDAYSIPHMLLDHSQGSNFSPFAQLTAQHLTALSNGHWGRRNEAKSVGNPGVSEIFRTEKLGFNQIIPGNEGAKFWMPGTGNLCNREFGI